MRASLKMNDSTEINVRLVEMKDDLIEVSKELTRGISTKSGLKSKVKGDKDIICKICDRYIDKIQKLFWNNRCEETIELEKLRNNERIKKEKREKSN
ncbi:hypothetical protein RhiirA5_421556 [Rhizophagus irregularis]|uniref:Uncharacterized protein n=1 Tax=Rhizophagus irregularis TaxID=588596 RepID=A0A2I1F3R0_9GLOM|nr:hypothetical protein RhiirA5_421556 [Rhizophagus irregularis]PKY29012.1 hypothetical protein RhiirB3_445446 [Rhizophagus irregularis]